MRTNKRYTNVTFTKRVDYEGGTHRPPKAPSEPRVCRQCGAVYTRRRWRPRSDPRAAALSAQAAPTVCKACSMQARGQSSGFLTMKGGFFVAHREEIERLIRNEDQRAIETNPLGRIIGWDRTAPDQLTVATSTEHLVERLGHALHRAFGGTVEYGFSHGNKFARGTWQRD
jgi:hypothetical protein